MIRPLLASEQTQTENNRYLGHFKTGAQWQSGPALSNKPPWITLDNWSIALSTAHAGPFVKLLTQPRNRASSLRAGSKSLAQAM
jgi:hypothetical protein